MDQVTGGEVGKREGQAVAPAGAVMQEKGSRMETLWAREKRVTTQKEEGKTRRKGDSRALGEREREGRTVAYWAVGQRAVKELLRRSGVA